MGRRWAVVLGVSAGFGAAIAEALAEDGFGIFGVHFDRRAAEPSVQALRAAIAAHDVPVIFRNENAASDDNRAAAIDALLNAMDLEDEVVVLVHSLAFGTLRPFVGDGAAERRHVEMTLDVMANSLIYWSRDIVRTTRVAQQGRILAMTSAGSTTVWPNYGPVGVAKAALEASVRQLAVELAPQGITVNALLAGVTDTAALRKIPGHESLIAQSLQKNPSGRLTTPHDVAQLVRTLVRPETHWLTGNVLRVDGGESIAG